jgi:hypothetical protein
MPFPQPEKETTVDAHYEWMKFYEAAVLETNSEILPARIEAAQNAIGQRVITLAVDETERRAIVKTLNALTLLKRERRPQSICHQCQDVYNLVNAMNGKTFIARTAMGETAVTLHTKCVADWADENSLQAPTPLRKAHAAGQ